MSIALVHRETNRYEYLSVYLGYHLKHPEFQWILYCDRNAPRFRDWLGWWPAFPNLIIADISQFSEERHDVIIDTSTVKVPLFHFSELVVPNRRRTKKVVMIGCGQDWDVVEQLLSNPECELTIIADSMDKLREHDPDARLRINRVEHPPFRFIANTVANSSYVLIGKDDTGLGVALAGQYNKPMLVTSENHHIMQINAMCRFGNFAFLVNGDIHGVMHEADNQKYVPFSALCPGLANQEEHITKYIETAIAAKRNQKDNIKNVAIVHAIPFHYEVLGTIFHMLKQIGVKKKWRVTLWLLQKGVEGEWAGWAEYYNDVFRGIPVDQVYIKQVLYDIKVRDADFVIIPTDDDPGALELLKGQMHKVVSIDHCPINRSGSNVRLATRTFDPMGTDYCGVTIPCYPTSFSKFPIMPTALGARGGNINVCVVGSGTQVLWSSIVELAYSGMANMTLITRVEKDVISNIAKHALMWKLTTIIEAPVWKMIDTILLSDAVLIPKAGTYLHHVLAGTIPLALSLGRPIVMPHPMAISIFGRNYLKDTFGSVVGYILPEDAPLTDETIKQDIPPPANLEQFKVDCGKGMKITEAVGLACKTSHNNILQFRDKLCESNLKAWATALDRINA